MHLFTLSVLMVAGVGAGMVKPSGTQPQTCQCVPKHMCMDDSSTDIKDLVDIRLLGMKCIKKDHICCLRVRRKPPHKVPLEAEPEESDLPDLPPFDSCGYQVIFGQRIIGGKIVVTGEVPWTTAILVEETDYWKFQCGGSLIHPQVVLTAGHCVYKYRVDTLRVRAGEIDNESESEPLPHQDNFVVEMVVHRNFHPDTLKNDIAILFLATSFRITPNVQVICLLSGDPSNLLPNCHSGGYGVDGLRNQFSGKKLKKVEIPLVPRMDCVSKLRRTRLGGHFNLHKSFICAGGGMKRDTCKGDGGSALVCPMKNQTNRFVQVGIVSWGIGCGGDIPGVYANVNMFRKWIDDEMSERDFELSVHRYE